MVIKNEYSKLAIGTKALILSKLYYSVLSKKLENLDADRYFSILHFLYENNGCNQQSICNNLAIDKTAMVKIIDYLIRIGFVDRNVNPDDRREHFIVLTKKGMKQTSEIINAFEALDKKLFESISKEEQQIFQKVICNLSSSLKEMPSTDLFFNYKKTTSKTKKEYLTK